jgi:hypothetical protein
MIVSGHLVVGYLEFGPALFQPIYVSEYPPPVFAKNGTELNGLFGEREKKFLFVIGNLKRINQPRRSMLQSCSIFDNSEVRTTKLPSTMQCHRATCDQKVYFKICNNVLKSFFAENCFIQ